MRWLSLVPLVGLALAQDTTTTTTTSDTSHTRSSTSYDISDASTITDSVAVPSGTYATYSSTITLGNGDTSLEAITTSIAANATTTGNQTVVTTTSNSVTVLVGGGGTTTLGNNSMNATATTTSTATKTPVINTRPCNGYVELCGRNYSNITNVAAHNSPFDRAGNAASNQMFDVTAQLNDGVRMRKSSRSNPFDVSQTDHSKCNSKLTTRMVPCCSAIPLAIFSTWAPFSPTSRRSPSGCARTPTTWSPF